MTPRTVPRQRTLSRRGGLLAFSLAFLLTLVAIPATASAYIYWSAGNDIGRANLDGTGANSQWVDANTTDIGQLASDAGHVYWSLFRDGHRQIGSVQVDGGGINVNAVPGVSGQAIAWGVAVDDDHIWFTTTGSESIGRANLNGSGLNTPFIANVGAGTHLAVDGAHIYWTSNGGNNIGRSNLDGTGASSELITGASDPRGIAVSANHIYWANWQSSTIGRANLDGTGVNQSFISTSGAPTGVAVEGNHVFWSNSGNIGRANLDGTGVNTAFVAGVGADEIAVEPDHEPPSLTIDSGPNGATTDNTPTFGFTAGVDATSVTCSIDTGTPNFGPCSAAGSHTPASQLADGSYTFRVKAVDAANNPVTQTRPFTVDTTPPDTTITSEPASNSSNTMPTFAFSSNDETAAFQCRFESGVWEYCVSPVTMGPLTYGIHNFEVRAIDPVGNADPNTESRTFTVSASSPPAVDTTAPVTTITAKPKSKIKAKGKVAKAGVSFSSEAGATFECQLDKAAFAPCTSPLSVSAKAKKGKGAKHTISVRATDVAGNVGTPATADFTVVRKAKKKRR